MPICFLSLSHPHTCVCGEMEEDDEGHDCAHLVLHLSDLLLGDLALLGGLGLVATLEERTTVLVELELGDHDVARVDADGHDRTVRLLAGDLVDVDDPLLAVHLGDLALTALRGAAHDDNLVVLADRHARHVVLLAQLLRQARAHHHTAHVRRRVEVRAAVHTARRRNLPVVLHGQKRGDKNEHTKNKNKKRGEKKKKWKKGKAKKGSFEGKQFI